MKCFIYTQQSDLFFVTLLDKPLYTVKRFNLSFFFFVIWFFFNFRYEHHSGKKNKGTLLYHIESVCCWWWWCFFFCSSSSSSNIFPFIIIFINNPGINVHLYLFRLSKHNKGELCRLRLPVQWYIT